MEDKEYIDNQIKWLKTYMDAEFNSVRKAVETYNNSNNEWKEGHNQLSKKMTEQGQQFITKGQLWAALLAVAGLTIGVISLLK